MIDLYNLEKLKEYRYDSLVYRFLNARLYQALYEHEVLKKDYEKCIKVMERDCLKFFQILDEAVGSHK